MSTPLLPTPLPLTALIHRLSLDPMRCLTPPHPWAPMSDAEWNAIAPFLAAQGCGLSFAPRAGRPPVDTRARLDAIFRAVLLKAPGGGRGTWRQLPPEFGKPDTVSRTYRRWARANLWARLLVEIACPTCPPILRRLAYRICCAFRRGIRLMGFRAILLARRLRLFSALPAPPNFLPDPDLSETLSPILPGLIARTAANPGWRAPRALLRALDGLMRLARGRRIRRWMEPA
ncbi:transposase [Siccirubricoccus phaeus]|uniref:transposase n=1 Tax=Siccirubricoccus phaeus TaxID=2595053 RepID=UPI00165CBD8F|nr:transposase [Siccirubricoccus phaeus]